MKLWLTGSRYFGNASRDSDTDYFAQDSVAHRMELEGLGFMCTCESINDASNLRALYWKRETNEHVQLVRNPIRKALVQQLMRKYKFEPLLKNKKLATALWGFAEELIEECNYATFGDFSHINSKFTGDSATTLSKGHTSRNHNSDSANPTKR